MTTLDVVAHIKRLRRYARFLCRNTADADDLVQDTLVKAIARADQFRLGTDLRVWLFSILHNTFVSGIRSYERRQRAAPIGDDDDDRLRVEADQDTQVELRRVLAAVDRLPDDQRRVILLVSVDGLTTDEAAVVLGLPVGTVRSRLARGREALRRLARREAPVSGSALRLVGGHDVQAG